jgi:hypothetical protein
MSDTSPGADLVGVVGRRRDQPTVSNARLPILLLGTYLSHRYDGYEHDAFEYTCQLS